MLALSRSLRPPLRHCTHDQLVDKGISRPPPAVHLLTKSLLRRDMVFNDQNLEVRPAGGIMRYAEEHLLAVLSMLALAMSSSEPLRDEARG